MATVEEVVVRIGADISNFARNMERANQQLSNMGQNAQNMGNQIASSFGAFSLAVGGALGYTVNKAADFDTAMRKASAIAGATTDEFDAMKQAALDLGATTSLSATQVADAMGNLAASGFDANQVIAAMPGIISAAEASGEDLALVSDTVAAALNSFGLEASEAGRVADILAQTANSSAAGIDDMQYAFKYAAPVFSSLGLSMEELAAATGLLANAGMAGEQAGTTLRAALLRLVDPPKEAANVMEDLGFSALDAQGNLKGIAEIAGDLGKSMEGMTEAQKAAALATIFGTEAVSGMLTLINEGPDAINEFTEDLENSEGASAAAAEKMKAGIGGALNEMSGAFETLAIVIGDTLVPYVKSAAEWLAALANSLTNMNPHIRQFLVVGTAMSAVIAGIIAVVGVFITIIGSAITAITSISNVFIKAGGWIGKFMEWFRPAAGQVGILTRATGLLARGLTVLTGPIGWAVAAVLTFVGAIRSLYNNHEAFQNKANEIWGSITSTVRRVARAFSNLLGPTIERMINALIPLGQQIVNVLSTIGRWVASVGLTFFKDFGDAATDTLETFQALFARVFPFVEKVATGAFAVISKALQVQTDLFVGFVEAATLLLQGDWAAAWQHATQVVHETIGPMVKAAGEIVDGVRSAIVDRLREITAEIVAPFIEIQNAVVEKLAEIRSDIENELTKWTNTVVLWFAGIPNEIANQLDIWGMAIREWTNSMVQWFESVPDRITAQLQKWGTAIREWAEAQNEENKRVYGEWFTTIQEFFTSVPENIKKWVGSWWAFMGTWFETTKENITNQLSGWGTAMREWFAGLPDLISTWLSNWWTSISEWFTATKENITTQLSEWRTAIEEWFAGLPDQISTWLSNWLSSITNWFSTTRENISTKLTEWRTAISEWFGEMRTNISTSLSNWWASMSTWFSNMPERISAKLEEWWTAIRTWFAELPNKFEIKNAGKNMVDKMAEGNEEKKEDFTNKLGEIIVDVVGAAIAIGVVAFLAAGREILERIFAGVVSAKNWAVERMRGVLAAIGETVTNMNWLQKGKDIVNGIIEGIQSVSLGGVASWIGNQISTGVDKFFDMRSPSKLMEDKGRNVILGYIQGIKGMKNNIARTTNEIAALMQPQVDPLTVGGYDMPDIANVRGSIEANMRGMEDVLANQSQQPAQIRLALGANEYETFVEDITATQERKNYRMKIFRG